MTPIIFLYGALTSAAEIRTAEPAAPYPAPQRNYVLGCGGCHGLDGLSNSRLVPRLRGLVGYYLNLPEGRDYLPRLPNVAFSTMNDRDLAAVLNFLVFDLGGGSAPPGAKPYSAAEVSILRKQPLNEVALISYRRKIVERLIRHYHASTDLLVYGYDRCGGAQENGSTESWRK